MLQLNPWMRFGLNNWLMALAIPLTFGAIALRMMGGRPMSAAAPVADKLAEMAGHRSIGSSARTATRYRNKSGARRKPRTSKRRARRSAA